MTVNVLQRKNERDFKKDKDKSVEPPKKKIKVGKVSRNKNKYVEASLEKMTRYNLYGFVWAVKIYIMEIFPNSKYWWKKDLDVITRGISWSIIEKFHKSDYTRLFAKWSNPKLTFFPSNTELNQSWFIDSLIFLINRGNSVVTEQEDLICGFGDNADEHTKDDSNNHSDYNVEQLNSQYQHMYNDSNIQPVDYDEPQNSNYVAKENALCEFDAIRPDDYHEPDNSYIMDKEDVLGEFDAIKATISIRKGEVSRAFLEKQLDLVKDRILVLEHALKQRYQNTSEDSVKQACNKSDSGVSDVFHQELASEKHQFTGEGSGYIYEESQGKYSGSVGYDDMLAPGDMMVNEENISETKLDDEEQEYHPTDKVEVQELHPPPKTASLIDNFEASVGSDDMLSLVGQDHINFDTSNEVFQDQVDMMAIEENISDKKFPETVDAGQLVDFATVQSSPPPNGIGDQNPHPTDMVEYLEPHPTPKQTSLIDNVEVSFIIPHIDKLRTMF
ncbi:hypothetical protein Tco_0929089 [Tanacetum coccineum]